MREPMPIEYIKVKPSVPKVALKNLGFEETIAWIMEGKRIAACGPSFNSEKEFKDFLELEHSDDSSLHHLLPERVALVCDRHKSGYCLAYGFIAVTGKGTYQCFQFDKPVRFEYPHWGVLKCKDLSKPGGNVAGTYVEKINTIASSDDYKNQFYLLHQEFFKKAKEFLGGLFSIFYLTKIKSGMPFPEIVAHAQSKPCRSRDVFVYMGLMTADGKPTEELQRILSSFDNKGVIDHRGKFDRIA